MQCSYLPDIIMLFISADRGVIKIFTLAGYGKQAVFSQEVCSASIIVRKLAEGLAVSWCEAAVCSKTCLLSSSVQQVRWLDCSYKPSKHPYSSPT